MLEIFSKKPKTETEQKKIETKKLLSEKQNAYLNWVDGNEYKKKLQPYLDEIDQQSYTLNTEIKQRRQKENPEDFITFRDSYENRLREIIDRENQEIAVQQKNALREAFDTAILEYRKSGGNPELETADEYHNRLEHFKSIMDTIAELITKRLTTESQSPKPDDYSVDLLKNYLRNYEDFFLKFLTLQAKDDWYQLHHLMLDIIKYFRPYYDQINS